MTKDILEAKIKRIHRRLDELYDEKIDIFEEEQRLKETLEKCERELEEQNE